MLWRLVLVLHMWQHGLHPPQGVEMVAFGEVSCSPNFTTSYGETRKRCLTQATNFGLNFGYSKLRQAYQLCPSDTLTPLKAYPSH